jgi:hypothetical protein
MVATFSTALGFPLTYHGEHRSPDLQRVARSVSDVSFAFFQDGIGWVPLATESMFVACAAASSG